MTIRSSNPLHLKPLAQAFRKVTIGHGDETVAMCVLVYWILEIVDKSRHQSDKRTSQPKGQASTTAILLKRFHDQGGEKGNKPIVSGGNFA